MILICILVSFSGKAQTNYRHIFGDDYQEAQERYRLIFHELLLQNGNDTTEAHLLASVVFPELLRYNIIGDWVETTLLEMWEDHPSLTLDFSIGWLQMKPSFVDQLFCHEILSTDSLYWYSGTLTPLQQKKQRVNQLQSLEIQVSFLLAFKKIKTKVLNELSSSEEKFKALCVWYNAGLNIPIDKIGKKATYQYFPHGVNFKGKQYSYSEIAWDFFLKGI